jgi:UPF0716 protein FxsA
MCVASASICRYEQDMGKLGLVLILLPVAELLTLVRLADAIGGWPTFLLVLASGLLGALIARAEGLRVLAQTRQAIATGTMPSQNVLNDVLVFVAAALLIVPGVITDMIALALLVPWSRRLIAASVIARVGRAVEQGRLRVVATQAQATQAGRVDPFRAMPRSGPNAVIDAEGETVDSHVVSEDSKPPQLGP